MNDEQRRAAIAAARSAIEARVSGRRAAVVVGAELPPAFGVFVTVKVRGELRGCLGALESRRDLLEEISRCAAEAASEDPRFAPVAAGELPHVSVEVSVLGPLEPIDPMAPGSVVVGRHGLVVEQGRHRGLLLPQVGSERRWTAETFLDQTCIKARLPIAAWRSGAAVYRFEAEVFGDGDADRALHESA